MFYPPVLQGTGAGGSLATVVGLIAASRGLSSHCMHPLVVAFDAPPVLAEGVTGALWGCGGPRQEACSGQVRGAERGRRARDVDRGRGGGGRGG